jgi:periplasmic protein CpxP/Spy
MNRTKLLTIAVIGLLLLNLGMIGVLFFTKPEFPMMDQGPRGEGPKKIIIERLHFDEQQQKEYELLVNEHKSKTQELHTASRAMHDELYLLLKSEPVDESKASSIIQSIADNQKSVEELNLNHFQKIKALCKPEQIKDFNLLVDDLGKLFAPKGPPRP